MKADEEHEDEDEDKDKGKDEEDKEESAVQNSVRGTCVACGKASPGINMDKPPVYIKKVTATR